jgi:hypothetical protein
MMSIVRQDSSRGLLSLAPVALMFAGLLGTANLAAPQTAEASRLGNVSQYRLWMADARALYPYAQSVDKMYRVMMCESGGNPSASGGRGAWLGLFQYAPGTWRGSWNPYRSNSIWDAKSQIYATAKAWSIGMQSHWSCYYKTAGR